MRPLRLLRPALLMGWHNGLPAVLNMQTPWHSSIAPAGPSGSQGKPRVLLEQLVVMPSERTELSVSSLGSLPPDEHAMLSEPTNK